MKYSIKPNARCAVIGAGSWATAIVKILLENEQRIAWYIREPEIRESIAANGTNTRYLQDVHFDADRLDISGDVNEVFEKADIVVLAVPSAYIKATLEPLRVSLDDKFIVSAIKGIIADEYITIAEFMHQDYGVPFDRIGIVSGPSHAEEVAMERLTYLTMVCKDMENAKILGRKFGSRYINTVYSTDIYGVEYGAVLKNIYALAVGICTGLGYGDNFMAVLIANSAMEMSRFMERTYPAPRDFNASVYLGDLLVTCYSKFDGGGRLLLVGMYQSDKQEIRYLHADRRRRLPHPLPESSRRRHDPKAAKRTGVTSPPARDHSPGIRAATSSRLRDTPLERTQKSGRTPPRADHMTRGKGSDPFPRCILTNAPSVFPSPRIPNLHDTPSETPATPVWRSLPSFNPYHRAEPPGGENDRIGPNTAGPTGSGHGLFPRRRFMQRTGFQRNGIRRPGQPTDRNSRPPYPYKRGPA